MRTRSPGRRLVALTSYVRITPVSVATQTGSREPRYFALGRTDSVRELAVVFTVRGKRVRVISARPMSRRERKEYAYAQVAATPEEADS